MRVCTTISILEEWLFPSRHCEKLEGVNLNEVWNTELRLTTSNFEQGVKEWPLLGLHYFDLFSLLEFDLFSKLYSDLPITGKLYFDLQALLTYRLVSLTLIYIVLLWSIISETSKNLIYKNNVSCKVIYNNLFGISWYRSQFVIRWTLIYTYLMPAGGFYGYRSQHAIMDFTHNVLLSVVHSCSILNNIN